MSFFKSLISNKTNLKNEYDDLKKQYDNLKKQYEPKYNEEELRYFINKYSPSTSLINGLMIRSNNVNIDIELKDINILNHIIYWCSITSTDYLGKVVEYFEKLPINYPDKYFEIKRVKTFDDKIIYYKYNKNTLINNHFKYKTIIDKNDYVKLSFDKIGFFYTTEQSTQKESINQYVTHYYHIFKNNDDNNNTETKISENDILIDETQYNDIPDNINTNLKGGKKHKTTKTQKNKNQKRKNTKTQKHKLKRKSRKNKLL